jgi:hypothetical protein
VAYKIADGYVEVHGRLDEPSFRRAAERVGGRAGDRFATAFGMSAHRRWRRMTRLFMAPIDAVSSALGALRGPSLRGGILAAILGLIPSLGKATAVVGAGLVPALLSLGSVIGVTRLMLGDLSKDIKGQTLKALNDMAGSIRNLAREAAKPGLNALLEGVVRNGPMFERYIQRIARAIGDALGEVGTLLGDSGFVAKLNKLLDSSAKGTRSWTSALDAAVDMVVTLGAAAGPIFEDFARRIGIIAERWRDFLNLKYETGELQRFLADAAEELNRWGRIFNNVIIGLFNIFAAGVGPSSRFAENLERITRSFREWTEKSANIDKIRKFFEFMVTHVDDFFRIAASATAIAIALKGVGAAVEAISWARMVAMLGPVGVALAVVSLAIAGVAAAFFLAYNNSELFRAKVGELWQKIENDLFPILKEWGTWFKEELAPVLEEFANTTLQKIIDGFDQLIRKYKENEKGLKEMRQLFLDLLPIVKFFAENAIEEIVGFVGQIMTAVGWVGRLVGAVRRIPVKRVLQFLFQPGNAIATILRITRLTRAIPRLWRTIYRFFANLGPIRSVINWLRRIPRTITTTFTSVTRNFVQSIPMIGGLFQAHGGIVGAQGMQTGGISGGRSVMVGERGPEMVDLPFGSRVTPAGQTRAALAGAGGGPQQVVIEVRSGGSRLDDLLVELLRKSIRSRAGGNPNSVQVVLGS